MNDNICIVCEERETLADYPACGVCAPNAHFPGRQALGDECYHCEMAKEAVDVPTLLAFRDWLINEMHKPTSWAITNPLHELQRYMAEKGIQQ